MKVLLLTHHFFPTSGGIESYALGLAKALKQNNVDCSVVCLNKEPVSGQKLLSEEIVEGIAVKRVPFFNLGFYKIAFGILKEIKKVDIVHVQNIGFLSDFAILTKFLHKKPVVVSTHGGILHTKERKFLKGIYSKWLGFLLKKADCIIADSTQDFSEFEKKAKTIKLIKNGVELEGFFSLKRKPKKDSFVFVGRLAKNKRIDLLIDAFALVLQKKPNAMLRIIGKDFDNIFYDLEQKTIDLEISNRVFFSDNASTEQLLELLAESEFFVSASESEGFGISAVEAMAAGCIPILNDIEAFRAFVEDKKLLEKVSSKERRIPLVYDKQNGFIANFNDSSEAAAKILAAMNCSEAEKRQLSENARARVQQYSWKNVANEIIAVYEGIQK